jgi:hypothetical protein
MTGSRWPIRRDVVSSSRFPLRREMVRGEVPPGARIKARQGA